MYRSQKQKSLAIVLLVLLGCAVMALVDGVLMLDYWPKSALKLLLFLLLPLGYSKAAGNLDFGGLFRINKKERLQAIGLGLGVYVLIVGGYFLLRGVFDFTQVTGALSANIGVSKENFFWVALYISFVNSLLEEFFFRGFAFLSLRRLGCNRGAWIFSAGAFALYHVAIMGTWFSPILLALMIGGLFVGGLIFNFLNSRSGSIWPSWLLHICANFGINTVGFVLFGII